MLGRFSLMVPNLVWRCAIDYYVVVWSERAYALIPFKQRANKST